MDNLFPLIEQLLRNAMAYIAHREVDLVRGSTTSTCTKNTNAGNFYLFLCGYREAIVSFAYVK